MGLGAEVVRCEARWWRCIVGVGVMRKIGCAVERCGGKRNVGRKMGWRHWVDGFLWSCGREARGLDRAIEGGRPCFPLSSFLDMVSRRKMSR